MDIKEKFKKYGDGFLKFSQISAPINPRPDICAFLLLDSIVPPKTNYSGTKSDIVCCAAHDQIWLDVDPEELERNATEDQIKDLIRCGVFYDSDTDSLSMFV